MMLKSGFKPRTWSTSERVTKSMRPANGSVPCRATATAWDAWTDFMKKREAVTMPDAKEQELTSAITAAISKSAISYKPRFSGGSTGHVGESFKLQHVDKVQVKELPKDLHDKLETIGVATLKGALSLEGELDYANVSYTTTDIDAALSVTGTTVAKGGEKSAVLVFVSTETERQASWSRLEGLILHWAVTDAPGGAWAMPPEGWSAAPAKSNSTGSAWECTFEKQMLGSEPLYVLVMQLPLRANLKSGGPVFVLKGTAAKSDRWLKDASTNKDFFLDLQRLPVTKL
ncbi:hypothetical protein V8C86DRAFT_2646662 [Haematococcus lacustris]|nr:hypothetical protein QJQ45_022072 [Haematococcus lacustris]